MDVRVTTVGRWDLGGCKSDTIDTGDINGRAEDIGV